MKNSAPRYLCSVVLLLIAGIPLATGQETKPPAQPTSAPTPAPPPAKPVQYDYDIIVIPVPEVPAAPHNGQLRQPIQLIPAWEIVTVVAATAPVRRVHGTKEEPPPREVLIYTVRKPR